MNFLERRSLTKGQLLADRLAPGETVVDFELARVTFSRRPIPSKIGLYLTDRSLLLDPGPKDTQTALPLDLISYLHLSSQWLSIYGQEGQKITMDFGRGPRGLGQAIRQRLLALPNIEVAFAHDDGSFIRYTYWPWRPGALSAWNVSVASTSGSGDFDVIMLLPRARHVLWEAAAGRVPDGVTVSPVPQKPGLTEIANGYPVRLRL